MAAFHRFKWNIGWLHVCYFPPLFLPVSIVKHIYWHKGGFQYPFLDCIPAWATEQDSISIKIKKDLKKRTKGSKSFKWDYKIGIIEWADKAQAKMQKKNENISEIKVILKVTLLNIYITKNTARTLIGFRKLFKLPEKEKKYSS